MPSDVRAGTHGVIFLFDVNKKWTFDYVISSLPEVPPALPILILVRSPAEMMLVACVAA